ncbi:LysR family transcriptional regulator [Lactobacillus delbrueckii]|nr:LysR family transcriptional regulator [Lactobacillus delbrueckii]
MYNSELDTFLAVAEAGSFSKAAKNCFRIRVFKWTNLK